MECELLDPGTLWVSFRTHAEARTAIFEFIEGFYSTHRRYSAFGNLAAHRSRDVRVQRAERKP